MLYILSVSSLKTDNCWLNTRSSTENEKKIRKDPRKKGMSETYLNQGVDVWAHAYSLQIGVPNTSQSMNINCNPSLLKAILPPFSYADQIFDATAAVTLASLWTSVPAYASNEPSWSNNL